MVSPESRVLAADKPIPPGRRTIVMDFDYDGDGSGYWRRHVQAKRFGRGVAANVSFSADETADVGLDNQKRPIIGVGQVAFTTRRH